MKIINETEWDTRQLRRVFSAVLRESNRVEGQHNYTLSVHVVRARGRTVSGYAYFHSGRMKLRLPSPKHGALDTILVGWLFDHELAHCRGHAHKVMGQLNHQSSATTENYPYLTAGEGLGTKTAPLPAIYFQVVRAARVTARLKAWEARQARAERAVKKLRRQAAYYARAINQGSKSD
jgi:hypothetical protein